MAPNSSIDATRARSRFGAAAARGSDEVIAIVAFGLYQSQLLVRSDAMFEKLRPIVFHAIYERRCWPH